MSFNVPVGIIQYQEMDTEEMKLFGLENYKNIYEIDMFIGENNFYGKGIGNAALNIMLDIVFKTRAKTIILCVQTENQRAIKCYEKTGFKIVKQISRIDGVGNNQENYLMILEK